MFNVFDDARKITIYEKQDAEELIEFLYKSYSDDIAVISSGGKNRNKTEYFRFPCSFDIETSTIRSGQLDYFHPDGRPVAFPYLFQFNIYGRVIMVRTYEDCMKIFDCLSHFFIQGKKRKLVLFDHNAGYEYGFFKDLWTLDCKRSFALDLHHPVTLHLTNGLLIRDSYKMTNMSLETLTKDWSKVFFKKPEIMDYGKLRTPYDYLDDDTILYSALDVLSLSDAMQNFLTAHNTGVWTRNPTSTSFIRSDLKKTIGIGVKNRSKEQKAYFNLLDKCKVDLDIYQMMTRQARGGNTHANRKYTGVYIGPDSGGAAHFDITSSYPAQMICYPEFPIHYWRPLDPDCPIDLIKEMEQNGYCTLFDVCLINPRIKPRVPVPYLANSKCRTLKGLSDYSDNGRYLKGASMLETTIYGIEWPIIENQYDFDDVVILRGYFARKGYLPDIIRRFILDLYAKKTQLKNVEGKEVEYALAKTYVNGVFGMAFTRILRDKCKFDDAGIYEEPPADPAAELERYQKTVSYFMPYAWGAMTATLGRVYLQRMIDAVGFDRFLYCDTDSVFALDPEGSRRDIKSLEESIKEYQRGCGLQLTYYDIKGKAHELGGIDEEAECYFKTYGAKKYITIEEGKLKCTIAGVPKKAGARIIGSPENFKLDMVFPGKETQKMCLWYNDDENLTLHYKGRPIRVYSNVAMLPVNYLLSLSDDYSTCLSCEGVNILYSYEAAHENMLEDYI